MGAVEPKLERLNQKSMVWVLKKTPMSQFLVAVVCGGPVLTAMLWESCSAVRLRL